MRLPLLLITAGAVVALAGPTAQVAPAKTVPSGTKLAASHHSNGHLGSQSAKGSKASTRPVTYPVYIYVPGPPPGSDAAAAIDPYECTDSDGNCTPSQQCAFWGENCPAPVSSDPAIDGSADAGTAAAEGGNG
jgi:hypothetical protein